MLISSTHGWSVKKLFYAHALPALRDNSGDSQYLLNSSLPSPAREGREAEVLANPNLYNGSNPYTNPN